MIALVLYVASIVLANEVVRHIVPVGFGLSAPAAVYVVGFTLVLRDLVQVQLGKRWAVAGVALGIGLSYAFGAGRIAVASALAFAASELLDTAVFTLLEKRFGLAVLVSGLLGLTLDSLVFLGVAFGSYTYLPGQLVGKAIATVAGTALLVGVRRAVLPRYA